MAPPVNPPGRSAPARRRRHVVAVIVALVLVVVVPLVAAGGWLWYELDPPGSAGAPVTVEVARGWGTRRIGDALAAHGVIGSSLAFQAYVKLTSAGPFHAGAYRLRRSVGVRDAVHALERGPGALPQVGLLPGLTLDQVAGQVAQIKRFSKERFLAAARSGAVRSRYQPAGVDSLEGLLAPDSYPVRPGDTELTLLHRMVAEFDQHAGAAGLTAGTARLGMTPYQVVTVASLIQREAKLAEDRSLIAAVIDNRLRDGTPLQIDATVIYARGPDRRGPITKTDLTVASPYNTYRVRGLPPTPISTVGAPAQEAALAPSAVPYRFYVLIDGGGKHAFEVTAQEHERDVAEARKKGLIP